MAAVVSTDKADSGGPHSSISLRESARQTVAEKWANRRKEQQEENEQKQGGVINSRQGDRRSNGVNQVKDCPLPPLCAMLQRSFREAVQSFRHQGSSPTSNSGINNHSSSLSSARGSFPSVLSVLQAYTLRQQVESFQRQQKAAQNAQNDNDLDFGQQTLRRQPSLLKVLPANYDFQQAITEMSKKRSRVFWLLDLAAIVQSHVKCRKECKLSPGGGANLILAYRLHHNADPKLLQLLHGLGVTFQVATKYDLQVCCRELQISCAEHSSADLKLQDDPTLVSKPNSFYRRLILDRSMDNCSEMPPITVDGPNEVVRITQTLTTMAARRHQSRPTLAFTLKVDSEEDKASWRELWKSTWQAAAEKDIPLSGLSVVLPAISDDHSAISECLSGLLNMLDFIEENYMCTDFRLYLCNQSPELDPLLLKFLSRENVSRTCDTISLDVSHLLVAKASALCTRIIGVKENNELERIHYYIDDGCYGSLSNVALGASAEGAEQCDSSSERPSKHRPLPLQPAKVALDNSKDDERSHSKETISSIVWGPTCDGLDKVCNDIQLPRLSRDDWLVFGDIGFCHVGTSFNGFDPPDIAYCVLGQTGYYTSNSDGNYS